MIIRIMLVCILLVTVGCGDFTSGSYESDYDGGGSYSTPSCYRLCGDICNSCLSWYSDIYFCEDHCERECRYASCNNSINKYTDKCNQIFTDSCAGDI